MSADKPMSLIGFHRFLIVTAIVFCFGFAGYEVWVWSATRSPGTLILALVFVILGAGLVAYLRRLGRILGYERSGGRARS